MSTTVVALDQRTHDIAAILQEIVDRPDWASGNPMAIIITGSWHDWAAAGAYDGEARFIRSGAGNDSVTWPLAIPQSSTPGGRPT